MTSLAFAGAGWITAVHGLAARSVPDLSVAHVASRTPRSAKQRADQLGATPVGYGDLPGDADAVLVATPPRIHLREAERAVDAGIPVLVESPLATTLATADELVALAQRGQVAYGENLVYSPDVAEAVRAVREMGAVSFLEVRLAQGRPDRRSHLASGWGGGALFDLGSHAIALALLLAAPARVVEVDAEVIGDDDIVVDDDADITLSFDTGLVANVRATWRAAAPSWDAQVASASGAVRLELVPNPSVEINGGALPVPPAPAGLVSPHLYHLGYVNQLAALAGDVDSGRQPQCGPAFGRLVLDIVCAAYASAAKGKPEAVPFTGRRDRTPHSLWRLPDEPQDSAAPAVPDSEPVEPVEAMPAEPTDVVPTQPPEAVPAEPAHVVAPEPADAVPAQPVEAVPAEPADVVPTQPAEVAPPEPEAAVPAEPVEAVPAQPADVVPSEPVAAAPAEPADVVPSEPVAAAPAEPADVVPSEPADAVPAQPAGREAPEPGQPGPEPAEAAQPEAPDAARTDATEPARPGGPAGDGPAAPPGQAPAPPAEPAG